MSAVDRIKGLLEREGMHDELAELRQLESTARANEAQQKTIAQVTRALLESEKTYRLVFSHEIDAMSLFDPRTGELLDVNDAWLALYGYTREEALSMNITDVSAEPAETRSAVARVPAGATTRIAVRWHRSKDGTVFPVELTAGSLKVGDRDAMYASARDITQRQSAERALARSEASFRSLIEAIPDGVMVHRGGSILYVNPAGRRLLGLEPDEDVTGMHVIDTVHPDDRAKVFSRVAHVMSRRATAPLIEERLVRRDGTSVAVEVAGFPIVYDGEPAVLAIARDVSQRKKMEADLVMNDRLASLGRLAASVGHELNNPLAYIIGNVTLLERELVAGQELDSEGVERCSRYVQTIEEGASRMRHIVHDLKTLTRADVDERVAIDVQQILDVCANMVEHQLRLRARLAKSYPDERVFVRGTEARLGQVFLNLFVNAAESIPLGHPDANEVKVTLRELGGRAIVEVADSGVGIDAAVRDRIFEPFFTTKEGSGTGLGLAISHGIVTELGGTLETEPRAGGGSVFRVVLPCVDGT